MATQVTGQLTDTLTLLAVAGGDGFLGRLVLDSYFWTGIALILFVALVIWKGGARIGEALDARGERIRAEIEEAQKLREEAQQLLADFKRKQRDAAQQAEAMVAEAKEEAARILKRAEAEIETSLKRREQLAMDRIAQAEASAEAEVRGMAVDIAMAATRRILVDKLDGKSADALVDEAIGDLPGKLH